MKSPRALVDTIRRTATRPVTQAQRDRRSRLDELRRLQGERQALLRLGALAGTAPIGELFDAIAEELARVVDLKTGETHEDMSGLSRFNPDATLTLLAAWGKVPDYPSPIGSTWPLLDGDSANGRVYRTGRPARLEGTIPVTGSISGRLGVIRANSSIAVPIFVDDHLWGSATIVSDRPEALPPSTEARLSDFAALVSTAISSAQRREEVRRLAEEQTAIRRVATVVAEQPALSVVFESVCAELRALLGVEDTKVVQFERDGRTTVVGADGATEEMMPIGYSSVLDESLAVERVRRTGRSVRIDNYDEIDGSEAGQVRDARIQASIAYPIRLGDRLWGALAVASSDAARITDQMLPPVADCVELIATAIRNTEAAESLRASRERIVTAADDARRRFERNLHDGAQQRLVALALELRHNVQVSDGIDTTAIAGELESIVTDLRDLSRGLHPAVLSEAGLPGAIKMLVRQCATPTTLRMPDAWPEIGDRTQVACFYLLSEALTNIVKHSRATAAELTVEIGDDHLDVVVKDDGVGGARLGLGSGSGLVGIADRVETLGGALTVESVAGQGTTLTARLPLNSSGSTLFGSDSAPGW